MRPQILFLAVAEICYQKTNYIASFGKIKFQMKPKTLIFTTSITKMLGHSPMCSETEKKGKGKENCVEFKFLKQSTSEKFKHIL
jgi:hypothetical protein